MLYKKATVTVFLFKIWCHRLELLLMMQFSVSTNLIETLTVFLAL